MASKKGKGIGEWAAIALGLAVLSVLIVPQWSRISRGQNDFVQLYTGAKLAGTAGLYSRAANQDVIRSLLNATMDTVMYTRPPFYAVVLKPLARLPYLAADALFCGVCVAALIWFVVRFRKECPPLPIFASFFLPVAAVVVQGQDTPLVLCFAAGAILAVRRGRDFLAGLLLSLCAIKFHLFLFLPLLMLLKQRWRILTGGIVGTAALTLLGLAVTGFDGIRDYIAVLRDPWINFSTDMMPNLHGLASGIAGPAGASRLEIPLAASVVVLFVYLCRMSENFEFLFALALLSGLLVSFHSGLADQVLLLLVFVLLVGSSESKPLRIAATLALSPCAFIFGDRINVVQPMLMLAILALAAFSAPRLREQTA